MAGGRGRGRPAKNGAEVAVENTTVDATDTVVGSDTATSAKKKQGGVKPGQKMIALFDWSADEADKFAEELTDTRQVCTGAAILAFGELDDEEKFKFVMQSKKRQAQRIRELRDGASTVVADQTAPSESVVSDEVVTDEIPV